MSDLPPIEKNIPLPGKSKYSNWAFSRFEVGDSAFYRGDQATIRSALSWHKKRHPGTQFITRKAEGGVRIWRVE
jgi:hypothetical protein